MFVDVVSLPAMITPVSDVDRALDAPEYVDAVIAPPAIANWPNWKFRGTLEGAAPYYTI